MSGSNERGVVIGGLVVVAAVLLVGLWLMPSAPESPTPPVSTKTTTATSSTASAPAATGSASPPPATRSKQKAQLQDKLEALTPQEREQIAAVLRTLSPARPVVGDDDAPALPPPTGTLSKESVQAAIQSVKPRIAACYDSALKGDPELAGTVVVQFALVAKDGVGVVDSGLIDDEKSTAKSLFFQACVLEAVGNAPFEAPEDGSVNVTYPFRFESAPTDSAPAENAR